MWLCDERGIFSRVVKTAERSLLIRSKLKMIKSLTCIPALFPVFWRQSLVTFPLRSFFHLTESILDLKLRYLAGIVCGISLEEPRVLLLRCTAPVQYLKFSILRTDFEEEWLVYLWGFHFFGTLQLARQRYIANTSAMHTTLTLKESSSIDFLTFSSSAEASDCNSHQCNFRMGYLTGKIRAAEQLFALCKLELGTRG